MSASSSTASRLVAQVLRLAFVVTAALGCGFVLTVLVSAEPLKAYGALLTGAWPDFGWNSAGQFTVRRMTRLGSLLEDATTLTLLGLAVAIPFRARQFSMGADGQLFLGAIAAAAVSLALGGPAIIVIPAACLAAMTTGFLWGLLPGVLKARFGASEIVTTLMLNVIAVQFYRLVITYWLRDPSAGFITTPSLPDAAVLTALLARTNVTVMGFVAILAAVAAWFLIKRTTVGYEITLVGENSRFAEQAGIPVKRATALSMALGGIFAGLAGFHTSNALLKALPVDLAPGLGFEGIVVALLARNNPLVIPIVAILYAYLRIGAQVMERSSDVTREMVMIIQAFIILFVIAERFGPTLLTGWLRARSSARAGKEVRA
ncbi:ABC transporter permease [Rhizobium sp. BK602]|uniref:ABC transporter permease n=1 Tax=Rhizobium sp. BK602 TaxID=2586986 RepID=UPI00160E1EBB|nr:ABC transporter permease [Rhizobium sp. BK602]MBB3612505.1 simple sugar transport system permease protein [Rhizobium sp. BK602]